jgi:preprotein translocase subunit SecB
MPALQPISFEGIYAQRMAQNQPADASPAGESGTA